MSLFLYPFVVSLVCLCVSTFPVGPITLFVAHVSTSYLCTAPVRPRRSCPDLAVPRPLDVDLLLFVRVEFFGPSGVLVGFQNRIWSWWHRRLGGDDGSKNSRFTDIGHGKGNTLWRWVRLGSPSDLSKYNKVFPYKITVRILKRQG